MPITQQAQENLAMLGLRPERLQMLDELLQRFINEGKRQAIIMKVIKKGMPIYEGIYGRSTREYGLHMDTIFQVCSITKPIIATLLFCLQEDGLIEFNEPIYKYLPEFKEGGREKICLWHFLTHSSGLKDDEMWTDGKKYIEEELGIPAPPEDGTKEEYDAFYQKVKDKMGISADAEGRMADVDYLISLKLPLKRETRSEMNYCSYGYQRLKEIIVEVTGETIDEFASRKIFQPLGMKNTAWKLPKEKWDRVIGREEKALSSRWFNSDDSNLNESGGGGLKTTVEDILRFESMILNGGSLDGVRILSKASMREMTKNHNHGVKCEGSADFGTWALGWNLRANKKDDTGMLRSEKCLDHGGYGGTKIVMDPDYDLVFALFSVEYETDTPDEFFNIFGRIANLLYSSFE